MVEKPAVQQYTVLLQHAMLSSDQFRCYYNKITVPTFYLFLYSIHTVTRTKNKKNECIIKYLNWIMLKKIKLLIHFYLPTSYCII